MQKLVCYIVDDEARAISSLELLLKNYCPEQIEILGSADDFETALHYLTAHPPDVLFLDIRLGMHNGFDLLKACQSALSQKTDVVMTTAYDSYAMEAFKYNAVNYLLKPIDPEQLVLVVNKIHQRLPAYRPAATSNPILSDRLFIPAREGWVRLQQKDILYMMAEGSYTHIVEAGKPIHIVSKNLKKLSASLPLSSPFFRVHKSYIVNINHIARVLKHDGGILEMSDGKIIPISPQSRQQLYELLGL